MRCGTLRRDWPGSGPHLATDSCRSVLGQDVGRAWGVQSPEHWSGAPTVGRCSGQLGGGGEAGGQGSAPCPEPPGCMFISWLTCLSLRDEKLFTSFTNGASSASRFTQEPALHSVTRSGDEGQRWVKGREGGPGGREVKAEGLPGQQGVPTGRGLPASGPGVPSTAGKKVRGGARGANRERGRAEGRWGRREASGQVWRCVEETRLLRK